MWKDMRGQVCGAVLLAQLLSLAIAATGVTSATLAGAGVHVPTTQALLNYLLLAATFGTARAAARRPLSQPWWRYALLAVLDVEANFLVTKAYQYTSITSVTLLDCFTIPAVMVLSRLVLNVRYRLPHVLGAVSCVCGLALLVLTEGASSTAGSAPFLGDALVLAGATCYAISNVAQEKLLGEAVPIVELLAMMGFFGSILAATQVLLLERAQLAAVAWSLQLALPMVGFSLALFCFYSLVPLVLLWGGATVLNLSLLSSDLWAAGARIALFGGFGGSAAFFAGASALVGGGIALYALAGGATQPAEQPARLSAYAALDGQEDEEGRGTGEGGACATRPAGQGPAPGDEEAAGLLGSSKPLSGT